MVLEVETQAGVTQSGGEITYSKSVTSLALSPPLNLHYSHCHKLQSILVILGLVLLGCTQ